MGTNTSFKDGKRFCPALGREIANFADRPNLLLDDQTPRDAAKSEEGRKQLAELMKVALYELDIRNWQFQLDLQIDAVLRELSLDELI
jgi:hypothetical protein